MVSALALMAGVHYFVDEVSQTGPGGDKATVFAPTEGQVSDAVGLQGGATYGLAGIGLAASGGISGPRPGAAGGPGMDPEIRHKANQMRKRYAERLSKMSTQDKLRALNKASKLLGTDVRSLIGR